MLHLVFVKWFTKTRIQEEPSVSTSLLSPSWCIMQCGQVHFAFLWILASTFSLLNFRMSPVNDCCSCATNLFRVHCAQKHHWWHAWASAVVPGKLLAQRTSHRTKVSLFFCTVLMVSISCGVGARASDTQRTHCKRQGRLPLIFNPASIPRTCMQSVEKEMTA